jgi:hypothetical protein
MPSQALPSSQLIPSATATWVILPVPGAHASVVHGLLSVTTTAAPDKQAPFASHTSSTVHAFPSLQVAPAGRFV